jgi:peptide-methionine (S)-S-oxide reductase
MSQHSKEQTVGADPLRILVIAAFLAIVVMTCWGSRSVAEDTRIMPAPAIDQASSQGAASETAVLAGGCFWGVQGVFEHVEGVASAVSGYAGGTGDTASYETVSTGMTGHAEAVRVTVDPHRISYGQILQIYFSVAHDPTELNRQGPDVGTQYRSAIFPTDPQ